MASLLDWISGQVEGAFSQINPFDNGATYNSVQRRRRRDETLRSAPRPPQVNQSGALQPGFRSALPTFNAANLSRSSVANQPRPPAFDLLKGLGDIGNGIVNATKPISQGGINPLADAGQFAEQNIVKPAAEVGIRAANSVALPIEMIGTAVTGANKRPDVQRHLQQVMQNSYITPEVIKGTASPAQFAKQFTDAGMQVANLLPINNVQKGLNVASGLTGQLAKQVLASNAKQSLVYGTSNLANDLLQGRPITPQSVLLNYGTPAALGTVSQLGGAGLRTGANKAVAYDKASRKALLDAGYTPKQIREGGFIAGPGAKGFKQAQAKGRVFEGVDGKPRFEVSDRGAKIIGKVGYETPLKDILDHPELYKQYPYLKDLKVTKTATNGASYNLDTNKITIGAYEKNQKGALLHEIQHAIQKKEKFAAGGDPAKFAGKKELQANNEMLRTELNSINRKLEAADDLGYSDSTRIEGKTVGEIKADKKRFEKSLKKTTDQLNNYRDPYEQYRRLAGEAEARAVAKRMNLTDGERYTKPMGETLYHGTAKGNKFDSFDMSKNNNGVGSNILHQGNAVYLTNSKQAADYFSKQATRNAKLRDSSLSLRQATGGPDVSGEVYKVNLSPNAKTKTLTKRPTLEEAQRLKKQGYDAIRFPEEALQAIEGRAIDIKADTIVVFNPDKAQILKPRSTFYDSLDVPKQDLIVKQDGGVAMNIDSGDITNIDPTDLPYVAKGKVLYGDGLTPQQKITWAKQEIERINQTLGIIRGQGYNKSGASVNTKVLRSQKSDKINSALDNRKAVESYLKDLQQNTPVDIKQSVSTDPLDSLKAEARKYKTAEEFVRANQNTPEIKTAEAKIAEIQSRPDYQEFTKGGKISGKTLNDNNTAGVEYRKAVDANTKLLTDIYNQAHTEAKAPAVKADTPNITPSENSVVATGAGNQKDPRVKQIQSFEATYGTGKNAQKAAGFRAAARQRAIDGKPTATELTNTLKYLDSNYIGKQIPQGTVVGHSFGNVRVKTASGEVISVRPENITVPRATKADAIAHLRKITNAEVDTKVQRIDTLNQKPDATTQVPAVKADAPKELSTTRPATTQAAQTGGLPVSPSTRGKVPPKAATQSPQTPPNLISGGRRGASVVPEILAPTPRQQKISAPADRGSLEVSKANPSTTKIQQKAPLVEEGRRSINGNTTSTYGLRDSFNAKENVPPALKDALGAFSNTRTVKSNKELWQKAQQRVGEDVATAMDFYKSNHNDDAVATGYALINRYMKQGNTKEAGALAMDMAERALESGRTTQAYALMKRLTPEGQITYVEKKIARFKEQNPSKAGKLNWSDTKRQELYRMAETINKMPEGHDRNLAIGKMQEMVDNIFPSSITDKAITVWKAGLLTSLRTHERNIVSNAINMGSELASQTPASLVDRLMATRTGQRTVVNAPITGLAKGLKTGATLAKDQILTGIDTTQSNLKYNINHVTWNNNKIERALKAYTETVFRPLGAEDKLFKEAARSNSFFNQAKAAGMTKGLKGQALKDFIKERANNPTAAMRDIAEQDAGRSTFAHDNHLAEIVKNAKAAVRRSNKPGAKAASAALDILMPFTQIPSGVASQLYSYSPIKLMKSSYDIGRVLITGNKELQRSAAQGFGRSVIGTSLIGAGAYLASKGLMTGQPKDDAEKAQWQAEGKTPNSVKVGDRWYQINSIGPQTILALAGGQMVADQESGDNAIANLAANIGKNFKDQTFLKGMSSALDAVDDPKRYAQSYIEGQATSVIPNIVKDLARAFDPNERQANGITDRAKQGIPGLSQTLPQKYDAYGQEIKNSGALELIDLFNSSRQKDVPETRYIDALRQATGTKDHVPTIADKTIAINGKNIKLNSQQYSDYQKYIGQYAKDIIGKAMVSPSFQNLPKDEQAKRIDQALRDINALAKAELFGNQPKNKLKDPESELVNAEKTTKKQKNRKVGSRRGGGRRSGSGITAGKSLVELTRSVNKLMAPRTTGSKMAVSGVSLPQMQKKPLRRYTVDRAKPITIRSRQA